jgi:acyl-CoA synthetase (AMP-forming)/AMP-acid ligase II
MSHAADSFEPCQRLLAAIWERADEEVVAFGPQGESLFGELRGGAEALASVLAASPATRWALCFDDSLLFAQALLACALSGREVVLPGHQRPAALTELGAGFDGILTDSQQLGEGGEHLWLRLPLTASQHESPVPRWAAPTGLQLTLFTSGSTGVPKAIPKAWHQLEAELRVLIALWGERLDGTRLLASVSHQHIYGLLFRILLPLVLGVPFARTLTLYPEQLKGQRGPWALIASPAFLSRLDPELGEGECRLIVSSGGPLALADALRSAQLFGQLPIEVFGSSETGGIAWRQSQAPHTPWQPMPGIRALVAAEDRLLLHSPFLPDGEPLLCADRIRWEEAGFHLLGRGDRLIKIEEKRISLDEVETRLQALPWVEAAAVLPLTVATRQALGAVLVLTPEGQRQWQTLGHGRFLIALRERLRPWLEPVALPRRVRLLATLPLSSQGKRPWSELKALFDELPADKMAGGGAGQPMRKEMNNNDSGAAAMQAATLPTLLEQTQTLDALVLRLHLDPALPWFSGHFPGAPLLPGVTQVHWAIHYGRQLLGLSGTFGGMSQLKFQRPLRPGQQCSLHLTWQADKGQLLFSYRLADELASSGRVRLCP